MPDITISDFAAALRNELHAEMRVHRNVVDTALRDVHTEIADARAESRDQHEQLTSTLTQFGVDVAEFRQAADTLRVARERRARVLARAAWLVNSAPGVLTTLTTTAGIAAGVIAFL